MLWCLHYISHVVRRYMSSWSLEQYWAAMCVCWLYTVYIDWEPVITHASSRVYCYITNDYGYITSPCDIYGTTTSPNPLHHSVYTYIVCRYRITVCLSETTSAVLVHGGFKVSNWAITHSQGGQDICVALPCIFCWRCLENNHWFPVNAWVELTLPPPTHTRTWTHTSHIYSLFQCSSLVRGNNTSDYTQHGGTHGGT